MARCISHQTDQSINKMLWTLILAWSVCLASGLSLEEQLQELKNNYIQLKEDFSSKVQQLNQQQEILAAKVARLEELELQVQQQQSMIKALQQEKKMQNSINSKSYSPSNVDEKVNNPVAATGMPKSCADLSYIGHTANGLYLILGTEQIETVFCDFTQLPSDPSFQTWIGHVDVKSSPIYFNVQLISAFNITNTPIPFTSQTLNVGGAMNMSSGIFTAPVAGKYFFSFSGLVRFPPSPYRQFLYIDLYVYSSPTYVIGYADERVFDGYGSEYETCSLQSTMHLQAGDQVSVRISGLSSGSVLEGYSYTHFTGWLLEEDIAQSLKVAY